MTEYVEVSIESLKELVEEAHHACDECSGPQDKCEKCIVTKFDKMLGHIEPLEKRPCPTCGSTTYVLE